MNNVWQDIKDRLAVEEVIQDYIPIISQGGTYKALCPFHREKSPSLLISKEKGIWHCFGCGQGGDIFAFVTEIENITKKEALEKLAKKAGVKLEKKSLQTTKNSDPESASVAPTSQYEQGLKFLEWTATVYHKILLKVLQDRQNPITQYCLQRGLTQEIIEKFQLGYAPKGNFLLELVKKHGLNAGLILEIGVLKHKINSANTKDTVPVNSNVNVDTLSDKFSDRLMIPVFNRQSKVVGFTGRVLPYDKSERPKYLNSPQTQWFNKSDLWYGWHLAKTSIIQAKKALIVEGNMDVVSSFKHGFDFTLASQGTSFTENQLKILKTITRTVWLAFDNDEAGKTSGDKFFKASGLHNLTVYKVLIPEQYKDLDDYLSAKNPETLEVLPYLDWVLTERNLNLKSTDSSLQKKSILSVLDLMQNLDNLSKEQYLQKLSQISKISTATLQTFLSQSEINTGLSGDDQTGSLAPIIQSDQIVYSSWQNLLAAIIAVKSDKKPVLEQSFILLSKILPQLTEFPTFNDYLDKNTEILNFIFQQKPELAKEEVILVFWKTILYYLDEHLVDFILDQNLKDIYLNLKGIQFL